MSARSYVTRAARKTLTTFLLYTQKIPCFNVARTAYHVSVFFLSLPSDPVADPFTAESKEDVSGSNGSTGDSRKVAISVNNHSLKALGDKFRCDARRETETVEACISGAECGINPAVTLTVDRITMTTSGALVLLFRDCGGELRDIRESLKKAFPGAPSQQTKIAHCTLLRAFPETETQVSIPHSPHTASLIAHTRLTLSFLS